MGKLCFVIKRPHFVEQLAGIFHAPLMPASKLKNVHNLFRSASKFKTTTSAAAATSSAEDVALKKYISSIDASTSETVRKQLLNYKSPKPDPSSSLKPFTDIGAGIGNFKLLSAADNEDSARLLSEEISAILRAMLAPMSGTVAIDVFDSLPSKVA